MASGLWKLFKLVNNIQHKKLGILIFFFKIHLRIWTYFYRLSVRVGVPATAVYVTTQEGLWGSTEETFLFYNKIEELLPGKEVVISKDQEDKVKEVFEKVLLVIDINSHKISILVMICYLDESLVKSWSCTTCSKVE